MNITLYSDNVIMNISMFVQIILFSFLSFLFGTFIISLAKKRKSAQTIKRFPRLSILIPAYNEEDNISQCLNSLLRSDYDKRLLEIIVIDDKSTDNTPDIVKDFIKNHSSELNIKLIQGSHQGKSRSLNLGVDACKNELIMTIDADVNVRTCSIKRLVAPMLDKDVAATNAVATIRRPNRLIEHFQMVEFCLNNLIRTSFSQVFGNSIWFFGAIACYKRSILKEVGYFKTDTLTEDMDICLEMYNKRYKIITVPDAMISTVACQSIKELFRQRMRWYFGALQSLFKNKQLLKSGKRSPPVIFLFVNQYWWTIFSFMFFPMTAYQIYYWFPQQEYFEMFSYLFRWFSLSGPFYVLYKLPQWGLNFLNIFGVLSGIITLTMSTAAISIFKGKISIKTIICLFFYFPYTIIQDAIIISGVIKYNFSKRRYFIN